MSHQHHYTQLDGYKHMLQVAENILYSSQIDQEILQKYQQLKCSIHKKMTPSIIGNNSYINKQQKQQSHQKQSDTFHMNLLSTYRLMIDNVIKIVQAFQQQLENQMQREGFNRVVNQVNERFVQKVQQLQAIIEINNSSSSSNYMSNNTSNNYTNKTKLLHRQQINTLRYQNQQLDSKFENLGLLIQVHKKMHQIILQATRAEQKKSTHQDRLKDKIRQLQQKLNQVNDVKMFMQQHKLTESNYGEFVAASKALKKILFANYQFK